MKPIIKNSIYYRISDPEGRFKGQPRLVQHNEPMELRVHGREGHLTLFWRDTHQGGYWAAQCFGLEIQMRSPGLRIWYAQKDADEDGPYWRRVSFGTLLKLPDGRVVRVEGTSTSVRRERKKNPLDDDGFTAAGALSPMPVDAPTSSLSGTTRRDSPQSNTRAMDMSALERKKGATTLSATESVAPRFMKRVFRQGVPPSGSMSEDLLDRRTAPIWLVEVVNHLGQITQHSHKEAYQRLVLLVSRLLLWASSLERQYPELLTE